MAVWRQPYYWHDDAPPRAATFLFGISVAIKRPIVVISANKNGDLLNPRCVYGARDGNGTLVQVAGTSKSPPITSAYTSIYFADIRNWIQVERNAWTDLTQERPDAVFPPTVSSNGKALHSLGSKDAARDVKHAWFSRSRRRIAPHCNASARPIPESKNQACADSCGDGGR